MVANMKNFIINIETKLDIAITNINKAIKLHDENITLANGFYKISVEKFKEIEKIITEINKIENKCQNSDFGFWHYKYKEIQEDISELKLLQDFYVNL